MTFAFKEQIRIAGLYRIECCERVVFWKFFGSPSAFARRAFAVTFWIVWLTCVAFCSRAQTSTDGTMMSLPPGVHLQIEAQPRIATVGDPIQIDLDITTPPGYFVDILKPAPNTDDFAILEFSPMFAASGAEKPGMPAKTEALQHHRARIVAAIYKTGKFAFPSIRISVKTAEGKDLTLSSPQVDIEIRSVLADKNPSLKDLKKQADISEPTHWILWLIIILTALVLGAIIWRYWKRRPRHPVALSPEQTQNQLDTAAAELRDLLGRGLPARGMEKQFYIRLSEIVKRILESGYAIQTAERTTAEIMDSLHGNSIPDPENKRLIESFLLRCDVVKFAKYAPSILEHEAISKDSMQILAEARRAVGSD
jgi:hypothetical protein